VECETSLRRVSTGGGGGGGYFVWRNVISYALRGGGGGGGSIPGTSEGTAIDVAPANSPRTNATTDKGLMAIGFRGILTGR